MTESKETKEDKIKALKDYQNSLVNMENLNILDDDFKTILSLIKDNPCIRGIDLKLNNISDKGVKHLIDFLNVNKTIVFMDLWGNRISKRGDRLLIKLREQHTQIVFNF